MNNLLVLHLFPLSVLYRGEKKSLPLYTLHAEEKEREGREGREGGGNAEERGIDLK